jgi:hypothetical protein
MLGGEIKTGDYIGDDQLIKFIFLILSRLGTIVFIRHT